MTIAVEEGPGPATPEPRRFTLAALLRWLGAATFLGGGAAFLVEGWTDASVFSRQAAWAVGTLTTTLLGILAARKLRDPVGARVFLALAAATIPAHFAQAGAAVYGFSVEHVGTLGSVMAAAALLPLLLPPLALGVAALVRRRGRSLASALFVLSAPLLVPTRDPAAIAALAGAQLAAWLILECILFRKETLFDSVEGVAARLMLLSPAAILLVRNAFYPATSIWVASLVACPSLLLLAWPGIRGLESRPWRAAQVVGVFGLGAAAMCCVPPALPLALALATVLLVGSEVVSGRPAWLAWCGAGFLASGALASYLEPGLVSALVVIPAGTLHAVAAFRRRSASRLLTTVLFTLAASVAHLAGLVRLPRHDLWIFAVGLGVLLLTLASLAESRKAQIQRIFSRAQRHFAPAPPGRALSSEIES